MPPGGDGRGSGPAATRGGGPLHLAIDATVLKVHGGGEWKTRVHGPRPGAGSGASCIWPWTCGPASSPPHTLTTSEVHDGAELPGLVAGVAGPIAAIYKAHEVILARGARPVIPPRHGAAFRPPTARG